MPLERKATVEKLLPYTYQGSEGTSLSEPSETRLVDKEFDPVTFCVLKVSAEDFASQLTLLDVPVFQAIQPDELTSLAWNTKDKHQLTPNVVAFTHRFNHVCFWCQKEILACQKTKLRCETLAHFIKIAKKLHELNNLHSAFAVISGLQSSAIYRLNRTWSMLSGKDRATFDKLAKLFCDKKNWEKLREYINVTKLPCIPYLGLYLTDFVYIDVAHPTSGLMDRNQRDLQMNNILRILADFQRSNYDFLPKIECVQSYLTSMRYIDELQRFVEEENYKLSLELEPLENQVEQAHKGPAKQVLLPGAQPVDSSKTQSLTPQVAHAVKGRLPPHQVHRKTQSLGTNTAFKNLVFNPNETLPSLTDCKRYLLDDSVMEIESSYSSSRTTSSSGSQQPISAIATAPGGLQVIAGGGYYNRVKQDSGNGSDSDDTSSEGEGYHLFAKGSKGSRRPSSSNSTTPTPSEPTSSFDNRHVGLQLALPDITMEGAVRRKTVLKDGKRPTVGSWTRYWLRLWGTSLLYYHARRASLPSARTMEQRGSYKKQHAKVLSIHGWMVFMGGDPFHPDTFQLQEPLQGTVYKFRTGTQLKAMEWVNHLKEAASRFEPKVPDNLMSFE